VLYKVSYIILQSENIERFIIGAMLYEEETANRCVISLKAEDFAFEYYKRLFEIMTDMYKNGVGISLTTVMTNINKNGLADIYNIEKIAVIVSEISTTANINHVVRDFREMAYRRKILKYAENLKEITTKEADIHTVINTMTDLPDSRREKADKTTKQIAGEAIERAKDRLKHKKPIQGEPTGLGDIDRITGGFKDGELILLSASPNVGKSLLALQICINFAKRNKTTLYFNFEMNEKQIGDRLVVMAADFEVQKLKSPVGNTTAEELSGISIDPLIDKNLYIYTDIQKTVANIRWKCKELTARGKSIGLIAVDYLQMMNGEGKTELERIDNLSKGLKGIATEFNTPVIVISSLNRNNQLRGSGRLDFDADQIFYMRREHNADNKQTQMFTSFIITKNRDGGKGDIDLIFKEEYLKFYCVPLYNVQSNVNKKELPKEFANEDKQISMQQS